MALKKLSNPVTDRRREHCARLDERQREAIDAIDGPLLVLAGPGTGKTQLLSLRAAAILDAKPSLRPDEMLMLTYTNAAVKALRERLVSILGRTGYDIEIGTFHSFANSVLLETDEAIEYVGDKIQLIDIEQVRAIAFALDHTKDVAPLRPFSHPYRYVGPITQRISDLKKDGVSPAMLLERVECYAASVDAPDQAALAKMRSLAYLYRSYEAFKEGTVEGIFDARGRYDYDDMILFALKAFREEDGLLKKYRERFKYVMVDEFQDTNEAQLDLLFQLLDYDRPNLCCVGDDDQSIYRFQGASVANFELFRERYPRHTAITLQRNYRSTPEIMSFACTVIESIPPAERAGDKKIVPTADFRGKEVSFVSFTTETEELLALANRINSIHDEIVASKDLDSETRNHPYNSIAVLVRRRSDIPKIADTFLKAGIPYATDGKEDIRNEKRVRQLVDLLKLARASSRGRPEEQDLLLYATLTSDYFSLPLADILSVIRFAETKRVAGHDISRPTLLSTLTALIDFNEKELRSNSFACTKRDLAALKSSGVDLREPERFLRALWALFRFLRDAHSCPLHMVLMRFIADAGVYHHILSAYESHYLLRVRELRSLAAFVNSVKAADIAHPGIRLDEYLGDLVLSEENGISLKGELVTMTQDGVRVYTAHGAKGLEFHTVFVPFSVEGKRWPIRYRKNQIALPPSLSRTRHDATDESEERRLFLYDEARLFYVASTRAKARLIFSAAPTDDAVASSFLTPLTGGLNDEKTGKGGPDEEERCKSFLDIPEAAFDDLSPSPDILRDLVRSLSLNPTKLNTYLSCRRRFLYNDVLRLPGPKRQSLVFGTCAHKALEEVYRRYCTTGAFPSFDLFSSEFKTELAYQGVDGSMEAWCLDKLPSLAAWFAQAARNPEMPIALEKKITVTLGNGIVFTGKFDKVVGEDEAKKLARIIDYKTGSPDAHLRSIGADTDLASPECDGYLRQLVAYKLLFDRDRTRPADYRASHGELVFLEPVKKSMVRLGFKAGEYVNKKVLITDDMVASLESVIQDVWNDIQSLSFDRLTERDSKKCGYCDYSALCWRS